MTSTYSSSRRITVDYSSSSNQQKSQANNTSQPVYAFTSDQQQRYLENGNNERNHNVFVRDRRPMYENEALNHDPRQASTNGEVRVVMYRPDVNSECDLKNRRPQQNEHPIESGSSSVSELRLNDNQSPYTISNGSEITLNSLQQHQRAPQHYSILSPSAVPPSAVEYIVVHHESSSFPNELGSPIERTIEFTEETPQDIRNSDINVLQDGRFMETRRVRDAQRKRRRRADESTDEAEQRRAKNLAAKRRRLEKESEEERARRRARDAETKRARRQRETSEQRSRRLARDSERMRRMRRLKKSDRALDSQKYYI